MKTPFMECYQMLLAAFGPQNWWPIVTENDCQYLPEFSIRERTADEKFEIIAGAILTQNTAWANVIPAIRELKRQGVLHPGSILAVPLEKIAGWIKPSGYYQQKAKKLKTVSEFIQGELGKDIDHLGRMHTNKARALLLNVWGIGPETADSILLYAFHITIFVIDAYTRRVFSRVGLILKDETYDGLQKIFEGGLPHDRVVFQEFHALVVALCKRNCRSKPLCTNCPLNCVCDFAKQLTSYAQECT